jgi:integrase/recombinase XerC
VQFLEQDGHLSGPQQLTRGHLEAYMAHLIDTRSAATANVDYRALQQLMRWLLDEEIDRSPMERMRPPIVPEKPVPVVTEAQLRALLASAKSASFVDRRDAAIIRLLLDTGGRLSEVTRLAVADLDFTEDVAHVIGKGRRPCALPFGQQAGLALGRHLRARAKERQTDRPEPRGRNGRRTVRGRARAGAGGRCVGPAVEGSLLGAAGAGQSRRGPATRRVPG